MAYAKGYTEFHSQGGHTVGAGALHAAPVAEQVSLCGRLMLFFDGFWPLGRADLQEPEVCQDCANAALMC
jgi:hypothetical protein